MVWSRPNFEATSKDSVRHASISHSVVRPRPPDQSRMVNSFPPGPFFIEPRSLHDLCDQWKVPRMEPDRLWAILAPSAVSHLIQHSTWTTIVLRAGQDFGRYRRTSDTTTTAVTSAPLRDLRSAASEAAKGIDVDNRIQTLGLVDRWPCPKKRRVYLNSCGLCSCIHTPSISGRA